MGILERQAGAGELRKAVSVMYAHFLGEDDLEGENPSSRLDPDEERQQSARL